MTHDNDAVFTRPQREAPPQTPTATGATPKTTRSSAKNTPKQKPMTPPPFRNARPTSQSPSRTQSSPHNHRGETYQAAPTHPRPQTPTYHAPNGTYTTLPPTNPLPEIYTQQDVAQPHLSTRYHVQDTPTREVTENLKAFRISDPVTPPRIFRGFQFPCTACNDREGGCDICTRPITPRPPFHMPDYSFQLPQADPETVYPRYYTGQHIGPKRSPTSLPHTTTYDMPEGIKYQKPRKNNNQPPPFTQYYPGLHGRTNRDKYSKCNTCHDRDPHCPTCKPNNPPECPQCKGQPEWYNCSLCHKRGKRFPPEPPPRQKCPTCQDRFMPYECRTCGRPPGSSGPHGARQAAKCQICFDAPQPLGCRACGKIPPEEMQPPPQPKIHRVCAICFDRPTPTGCQPCGRPPTQPTGAPKLTREQSPSPTRTRYRSASITRRQTPTLEPLSVDEMMEEFQNIDLSTMNNETPVIAEIKRKLSTAKQFRQSAYHSWSHYQQLCATDPNPPQHILNSRHDQHVTVIRYDTVIADLKKQLNDIAYSQSKYKVNIIPPPDHPYTIENLDFKELKAVVPEFNLATNPVKESLEKLFNYAIANRYNHENIKQCLGVLCKGDIYQSYVAMQDRPLIAIIQRFQDRFMAGQTPTDYQEQLETFTRHIKESLRCCVARYQELLGLTESLFPAHRRLEREESALENLIFSVASTSALIKLQEAKQESQLYGYSLNFQTLFDIAEKEEDRTRDLPHYEKPVSLTVNLVRHHRGPSPKTHSFRQRSPSGRPLSPAPNSPIYQGNQVTDKINDYLNRTVGNEPRDKRSRFDEFYNSKPPTQTQAQSVPQAPQQTTAYPQQPQPPTYGYAARSDTQPRNYIAPIYRHKTPPPQQQPPPVYRTAQAPTQPIGLAKPSGQLNRTPDPQQQLYLQTPQGLLPVTAANACPTGYFSGYIQQTPPMSPSLPGQPPVDYQRHASMLQQQLMQQQHALQGLQQQLQQQQQQYLPQQQPQFNGNAPRAPRPCPHCQDMDPAHNWNGCPSRPPCPHCGTTDPDHKRALCPNKPVRPCPYCQSIVPTHRWNSCASRPAVRACPYCNGSHFHDWNVCPSRVAPQKTYATAAAGTPNVQPRPQPQIPVPRACYTCGSGHRHDFAACRQANPNNAQQNNHLNS
ncbi:unnamed protein product [Sphagnum tenellum]